MKENALNIDKDKAASSTVDKTSTTKDDSQKGEAKQSVDASKDQAKEATQEGEETKEQTIKTDADQSKA